MAQFLEAVGRRVLLTYDGGVPKDLLNDEVENLFVRELQQQYRRLLEPQRVARPPARCTLPVTERWVGRAIWRLEGRSAELQTAVEQ